MNASDVLKYGHLTVLKTIDGLTGEQWTVTGACGHWSCQDLLAHLTSCEVMLVEALKEITSGGPVPTLDHYRTAQDFNDSEVEARQGRSVDEVLAEYNAAHAESMRLIKEIPAETLRQPGLIPWYGAEYSLDDFIVYAIYAHKREHCGQIAVFRDRFK